MSFDWFMDQIAYNNSLYFPPKEISRLADGKLKNIGNGFCIGLSKSRRFLKFYECNKVGEKASFEWWEAITFSNGFGKKCRISFFLIAIASFRLN